MYGKSADFFFHVDSLEISLGIFLGSGLIKLYTENRTEIIYGSFDVVCSDSDVTVLSEIGLFHIFNGTSCKYG